MRFITVRAWAPQWRRPRSRRRFLPGKTGTATAYSFIGPSSGVVGIPTSNFTVTPDGSISGGDVTITPDDDGNGGTFTPTTVTFTNGTSTAQTFTYTPATDGTFDITVDSAAALSDPAAISFTASAVAAFRERGLRGVLRGVAMGAMR
jgi:hypothetical protein